MKRQIIVTIDAEDSFCGECLTPQGNVKDGKCEWSIWPDWKTCGPPKCRRGPLCLAAECEVERLTQKMEILESEKRTFWKDDGEFRAEVGRLNNELAVALRNIQVMFDQQRKQESEVARLKRENEALRDMAHEDDAGTTVTVDRVCPFCGMKVYAWEYHSHGICAEAERLTRENEALRDDVARAEKLLQGDSHDGCAVIEMQLKALLRECNETLKVQPDASGYKYELCNRIRAALGEG